MARSNVEAMAALVGRTALLTDAGKDRGLAYPVKVSDVRSAYGTIRALVTPIGGKGNGWVAFSSLTLVDTTA